MTSVLLSDQSLLLFLGPVNLDGVDITVAATVLAADNSLINMFLHLWQRNDISGSVQVERRYPE